MAVLLATVVARVRSAVKANHINPERSFNPMNAG
jgi:hypothetical protein